MFFIRCNSRVKSGRNKNDSKGITKNKLIINKYNWKRMKYPSEEDDWKKIEKNDLNIAFNILHVKNEKIYPAFV